MSRATHATTIAARCLLPLLLFAGGCGQQSPGPTPAATSTSTHAPAPTTSPHSFQNPVLRSDFPDPFILREGDMYYGYATNASGKNVQAARSPDLVHWELLPDALPALPVWAKPGGGFVWAPEVIKIGDRYVLYYVARDRASNRQCIGVATGEEPRRFRDDHDRPLICQTSEGGSIDPSPFRDGDHLYLYWKNDGNCCGYTTYIYVQELAPDGQSLLGQPIRLLQNDQRWEGAIIEAPTMWKQEGKYYLFFSGNLYSTPDYAVGYATCQSPTGPCQDAPENPILKSSLEKPPVIGPGHQAIILDKDGETWMVYHAWEVSSAGVKTSRRLMWIDRLTWEGGKPHVHGPTTTPQRCPDQC